MKRLLLSLETSDGRQVYVRESDDHVIELEVEGQVIARFSQTSVTIENILKEVNTNGRRN